MNQLLPFDFKGHEVRTFTQDEGEVWFLAQDVAHILEYRDAANLARLLADDETGTHNLSIRSDNGVEQRREMVTINEPGLYRAVFTSRSSKAEPFRRWVFHEVLPTLRRDGQIALPGSGIAQELTECVHPFRTVLAPLRGNREGLTTMETKVMWGFDQAMQKAGLPAQFKGIAPDPEMYLLTTALARVLIETLAAGKPVHKGVQAQALLEERLAIAAE